MSTTKAEQFYIDHKEAILNELLSLKYSIEHQEYDQIAVWFNDFCICYQNGIPICHNVGTDTIYHNVGDILAKKYPELIDNDLGYSHEYIDLIINEFCEKFAEKHNINFNE